MTKTHTASASLSNDLSARTNVSVVAVNVTTGDVTRRETKNVTCVGGHEAVAQFLGGADPAEPSALALGTGGGTGTDPSDRSLNVEEATTPVNSTTASGTTATIRAFVPSLRQLASDIDEVGVVVNSGDLLNHATITPVDLSGTDTLLVVTTDITITDPTQP